jgi:hypothetical protein
MYPIARLLQVVGLTILPLAMVAQLSNRITAGEMLKAMLYGLGVFMVGYLLQSYRGAGK